jgi:TRAP-type C4-dicarboxylate transport system substrate-binding protein
VTLKIRAAATLAAAALVLPPLEAGNGTLKLGTIAPDQSIYVKTLREMGDACRQRTNGRLTMVVYPGGDHTEEAMLRDMRPAFRKLHGAQLSAITLGNVDHAFNVFGLPMFFESYAEADRVLERIAPELEKRLEARQYKALNFAYVGWVHIFSREPVSRVDDLRRLPMYTSTGDDRLARWYSANGFKAVQLDPTSMLTSLKTNMIGAIPAPPLFAHLLTWYKSAPYMMDSGFAPLLGSTVISLDVWNGLPAGDQGVLLEEARRAGDRLRRDIPRLEAEAIAAMKKTSLTVTRAEIAEWRAMADRLGEAMRKEGVVPDAIYDAAKRERDAVRAGR